MELAADGAVGLLANSITNLPQISKDRDTQSPTVLGEDQRNGFPDQAVEQPVEPGSISQLRMALELFVFRPLTPWLME
jgi:hypothetical protein